MIIYEQAAAFGGLEFALFQLKEGVTEDQLIALSEQVDQQFLAKQPGLLAHFLLRGKDGTYADVALATTQETAEAICQRWLQNGVAQQYLDLLDQQSVDMSFWTRIS